MIIVGRDRRAPRGARGLKLATGDGGTINSGSRPARGAWIETFLHGDSSEHPGVAPRAGRVD